MKLRNLTKVFALAVVSAAVTMGGFAQSVFSDTTKDDIAEGFDKFSQSVAGAAPMVANSQNVWSDAYIGTLLPGLKFGGGLTLGGAKLDMTGFNYAVKEISKGMNSQSDLSDNSLELAKVKIPDTLFLPTVSVDARIGGIFFPFDVGLCAMITNPTLDRIDFTNPESLTKLGNAMELNLFGTKLNLNYTTLGIDFRYCIFDGKVGIPDISLGAGYYYLSGLVGTSFINSSSGGGYSQNTNMNMALSYTTNVMYVQAQISSNIAVATIFGGAKGMFSTTSSSWAWDIDTKVTNSGTEVGNYSDKDGRKYSTGNIFTNFQPLVYAGASFNFLFLQTTVSAGVDARSIFTAVESNSLSALNWNAAISLHIKL